ncbi:MAG: hypothetical protein H7Z41_01610 [Cytophagales bacterium]|nr:hypothetical protein [Armatimonadota bacterium]
MRQAAMRQNRMEYLPLWAGQGSARIRPMPAARLVQILAEELQSILQDAIIPRSSW